MEPLQKTIVEKYNKLCNFLESDTIGTEVLIYGTSGLMLLVAYAKRKPTYLVRQFKRPSHIPDRIINERVMHTGLIKDIQQHDKDTLLMINHRPIIPFFTNKNRVLPVKLPGVQVNGNGYSWLQNCIVGRQATFIPLAKSKRNDYVVSQLCLVHPPKGSKLLDVSETLLKLRFAKYVQDATATAAKRNNKYYKHLKNVETTTIARESWLNWVARYPWLWNQFRDLQAKLFKKETLLPELVR